MAESIPKFVDSETPATKANPRPFEKLTPVKLKVKDVDGIAELEVRPLVSSSGTVRKMSAAELKDVPEFREPNKEDKERKEPSKSVAHRHAVQHGETLHHKPTAHHKK